MEHIIQFAIGIDDDTIAKRVEENAEKAIIKDIKQQVEKCIFATNFYGDKQNRLSAAAEEMFKAWMEQNKDAIIEQAAKLLADKLARSKAVKAAVGDLLEEATHAEMQN